jgi:uncharacterized protein
MAVSVQRPLLIGGIAISFGLWILQSLHHSFQEFGEIAILGVMGIGAGLWWFRRVKVSKVTLSPLSQPLTQETVDRAISDAELLLDKLVTESEDASVRDTWQTQLERVKANLDRTKLNITVTGGKSVGKTSICQALTSVNPVETPPLLTAIDIDVLSPIRQGEAELVLLVTNGDLTSSEAQILQELKDLYQRTLLVFNKQDQYAPEDRSLVLQQLQRHAQGILNSEDIVATASVPSKIEVRQELVDGTFQESWEQPSPDVDKLTQRLEEILTSERQQLIWASTWRKATDLQSQIKDRLNKVRRDRALPIIEQYQWITAATAFANPVPALDLLATAAINAQLVLDLGQIYQQKFSLDNAQTVASGMGSLMVKQGLVELSSQAIATVLKSHVATFVAGGVVQGLSAAYLTRVAALTLIEYFESQPGITTTQSATFNLQQLSQILANVFQNNQRTAYLQSFVTHAISQLKVKSLLPQTP